MSEELPQNYEEPDQLTDEEEEMLDQAWASVHGDSYQPSPRPIGGDAARKSKESSEN